MRVLHLYSGNLYGGIEAVLITLARHRAAAPELEHRFALAAPGRLAGELAAEGLDAQVVGPVRWSRPWTVLAARRRLRRLIATDRPDVMIGHAAWPHALFAPEARRAGVPLAFWAHDAPNGRHWVERLAARTPPDLAIANSRFTAGRVDLLFPKARREVLYYPVPPPARAGDPASRAGLRRELDTPESDVVIATTCRLEAYKGHALLVDALSRLRDVGGWRAWVAGGVQRPHERDYLDSLKNAAEAGGVADRVRFLGQRSDVPRVLAAADLHCQPNLRGEPFGVAFVEALYAGLPVVSTAMGGALEIVDPACGVLVPPGDAGALAAALKALIADPAARARLGANGPARAAALCEPAAAMRALRDLLAGVAGGRRSA